MTNYYYTSGELIGMIQGVLLVVALMIGVGLIVYIVRSLK